MKINEAIREMFNAWTKIEAEARRQRPNASDDEIYQMVSGAMNHQLGR